VKLPAPDDPGGNREGRRDREIVLAVLRDNGVAVNYLGEDLYLLSHGDEVASYVLGEVVGGLLIRRLAKQFAIHIVEFYFSPFVNQRQNKN
jgi:hypothetical protein